MKPKSRPPPDSGDRSVTIDLSRRKIPQTRQEVDEVVRESIVIDMLGLLTLDYRRLCSWQTKDTEFPAQEFTRLKRSGVTVVHPAVGFLHGDVRASSWGDLTRWNLFLATHPDKFTRVDKPADIEAFAKAL